MAPQGAPETGDRLLGGGYGCGLCVCVWGFFLEMEREEHALWKGRCGEEARLMFWLYS